MMQYGFQLRTALFCDTWFSNDVFQNLADTQVRQHVLIKNAVCKMFFFLSNDMQIQTFSPILVDNRS